MALGVRRSITDLQKDYDSGNKAPLETLMRAWKGFKELKSDDPNSFFVIGGYHGEPFRGPGKTDSAWWGGYCQHGTVLFPSWHRAYLYRLEKALQSIPGCAAVMLPFWDECSTDSQKKGIPRALTDETFVLDGVTIPNPLRSFVLPVAIDDQVDPQNDYSKPAGYETVRYPLSGLVGTPTAQQATTLHNAQFPNYQQNVGYLNDNIITWLSGKVFVDGAWLGEVETQFLQCLNAPNYTLFSNTTSAGAQPDPQPTPLEQPHNMMHLAVGGFDYPGVFDASPIPGANGDMGENDTAGLDPIFFFHHCFIDYTFWIWQRRHNSTKAFTIDPTDPGTKYSQNNPPPAGGDPNATLSMTTPLDPFPNPSGSATMTTNDVVDIENQLGYTYGPGSLDQYATPPAAHLAALAAPPPGRTVAVTGINRANIRGSFLITAFRRVNGKRQYLGTKAVLSRWHLEGCMNCQNHLEAKATFPLAYDGARFVTPETAMAADADPAATGGIEVEVRTHTGLYGGGPRRAGRGAQLAAEADAPYKVEIR